ncbi:hypothetical protein [Oceanobacillus alkalisoli]|uniref:hypothetical protein n=1 Tax=Oceanobacillus alkalisoli TaxID=2925113 RepID=UPI001F1196D8|nr:hypothetical protein [Oceanobacillus alkalisoli]MCF3943198.1 hypothetical protein [Oceanobacillus alkalisoli]
MKEQFSHYKKLFLHYYIATAIAALLFRLAARHEQELYYLPSSHIFTWNFLEGGFGTTSPFVNLLFPFGFSGMFPSIIASSP